MDLALSLRRCLALPSPATTPDLIRALVSDCLPTRVHLEIDDLPPGLLALYACPLPPGDAHFQLAASLPRPVIRLCLAWALLSSAAGDRYLAMRPPHPDGRAFPDCEVRRGLQVGWLLWGDEPLHHPELQEPAALAEWGEVPELFAREWLLRVPWQEATARAWDRRLDIRRLALREAGLSS